MTISNTFGRAAEEATPVNPGIAGDVAATAAAAVAADPVRKRRRLTPAPSITRPVRPPLMLFQLLSLAARCRLRGNGEGLISAIKAEGEQNRRHEDSAKNGCCQNWSPTP
ncbi:hypothetical protein [Spongiactinospora rosea]|uniref:hypothetical protein n=1 Tax=Spongiactinospora rosea TaxID=2248750 RepID=UPI001CECBC7A|nr:hypothetical protein [Spongiactinospora rosea]